MSALAQINRGTTQNDGTGDSLYVASGKINDNTEITVDTTSAQSVGGLKTFTSGIKGSVAPAAVDDLTRKDYVDTAVTAFNPFVGGSPPGTVTVIAFSALPTNTYDNGTAGVGATITINATGVLTVDSHNVALNDLVFVGADGLKNGPYKCTTAGAMSVAAVMTRCVEADTAAELGYCAATALLGTLYAGHHAKIAIAAAGIVVGTTILTTIDDQTPAGVAAETAAREAADAAIQALATIVQTVGRPHATPPITGSAISDRIYVMNDHATRAGLGVTVRGYGISPGTLYINTWTDTGTLTKDQEVSVSTPSGAYELTVSIAVKENQVVGFRGASCYTYTTNTPDGTGWKQNSATGDASSFVPIAATAGVRLEIGFDIQSTVTDVAASVDAINATINPSQTIGRPAATPPITGTTITDHIYIQGTPASADGAALWLRGYGITAGSSLDVHTWSKSGSTYTKVASQTVTVPAGPYIIPLNIAVQSGQYIGFRGAGAFTYTSNTADGAGWLSNSATGDASSCTPTAGSTSVRLEIGVDVVTDLASALAQFSGLAAQQTWKGKNVSFAGDSITAYDYFQGPCVNILGATWVTFTGDAVSGRKMADLVSYLTSGALGGVDAMIVGLGTNDFGMDTTLGAYGDGVGAGTFYGDTKNVIVTALTAEPLLRIMFWTPPKRGVVSSYPAWNTANGVGKVLADYVTAIKLVCADYGIPVVDMFVQSGINDLNYASTTIDNLHPLQSYSSTVFARMFAKALQAN